MSWWWDIATVYGTNNMVMVAFVMVHSVLMETCCNPRIPRGGGIDKIIIQLQNDNKRPRADHSHIGKDNSSMCSQKNRRYHQDPGTLSRSNTHNMDRRSQTPEGFDKFTLFKH
ncbi:uncharacterized protein LOC118517456 [Anopheles stephensi]|uniref:uncharacterized protein LOC118517456 n=1 Tax=Anopheles stephensi TaxID=30069 RepID=UPI001658A3E1|nr:uncharacterized protein LOC118517456 [Anopheles stephensi]